MAAGNRLVSTNLSLKNCDQSMLRSEKPYPQPNPRLYCIFCNSANHSSNECRKYKSSKMFWKQVLDERRCKNCLRLFHKADRCYNESFCHLRACRRIDKHSEILCNVRYINYHYHPRVQKRYSNNIFVQNEVSMRPPYISRQHNGESSSNALARSSYHGRILPVQKTNRGEICQNSQSYSSSISNNLCDQGSQTTNYVSTAVSNVSTQTCEFQNPEKLSPKVMVTKGCQTENKSFVEGSAQTRVFIPPSEHIYNEIPAAMVGKVNFASIGYVIKKEARVISSDAKKCDKLINCDPPSIRNVSSDANDHLRFTEGSHSTQSPIDPLMSLTNVVAKAREEAMKGFRNFPRWK